VIYGTSSGINFADYTNTTHMTTNNRLIPINSNVPQRFYVQARPMQNKSVVSTTISADVVAGGGGIPPSEAILAGPTGFNLIVHSGLVVNDYSGQSGAFSIDTQEISTGGASLIFGNGTLNGETLTVTPSGSVPGSGSDANYQINNNFLTEAADPPFSG